MIFLSYRKFLGGLTVFLALILIAQKAVKAQHCQLTPLEISFLNVGQGDAILIDYLARYQVLIDGGPNKERLLTELNKVMPWGDREIEIVILTHPDKDHLAGLTALLQDYQVGIFLDNGQTAETEIYHQLEDGLKKKNIARKPLQEGSKIEIGRFLKFKAYNPDEISNHHSTRNDSSIVLRMDFGKNSFLFTGDAEFKAEKDMLYDEEDVDVDWLKAGHHGSKCSTSKEFLKKVTPQFAVISVGKGNRFGHPTKETLERLKQAGAEVYRTDQQGTIRVRCKALKEKCQLAR